MTIHVTDYKASGHAKRPLAHVVPEQPASLRFYRDVAKPTLDKVLVIVSAPLVLPLLLIVMLLAMLDGGKPFYSQLRVGRGGQTFRMWKFRTMVADADAGLESYLSGNAVARAEWNATQKLKSDPRITPIGHFLRKTSLDELPQLFNVLTGSMALVGPRPIMLNQRCIYTGQTYYDMVPGITGLWQISDRNNCDFVARIQYDDTYGQSISLATDLRIMLKTLAVVLRGTGC